jgi:hypothetical protein
MRARTWAATAAIVLTIGCGGDDAAVGGCEPFDVDLADELITNMDTGRRKIDGEIRSAVIVETDATISDDSPLGAGRRIGIIAINVDDEIVALAHGIDSVVYGAVDEFSERATGFPLAEDLGVDSDSPGVDEARECARSEGVGS